MKRLLAHGCDKLFQICHCFRKEEVGSYHQTEFSMLEWYCAGWSYVELMDECEDFLQALVRTGSGLEEVQNHAALQRKGRTIPLAPPWERLTVAEAFHRYSELSVQEALEQDMFDEILVTRIEPNLGWDSPVFLCDYPAALGSLAKKKDDDVNVAERFELYVAGIELANGFSELTDPAEQRLRFITEMDKAKENGIEYPELPEKFLTDLENLNTTAGIALGIDRLFMILMGCDTVADVMSISPEEL